MGIDLNLLAVFDAVMLERHVTRAARRLHTTQPAVSNALRRLREQLDDELFVKVPGGVRPTSHAEAIWPAIHQSLTRIEQTLTPAPSSPATFRGTVTLSLTDYAAALLLPPLIGAIEEEAPGLDVRTVPNLHVHSPAAADRGDIDLALGVFGTVGGGLSVATVLQERYVCIMRRGHPLSRGRLTAKRLAGATFVLVAPSGEASGIVDEALAARGLKRRVGVTVNQFMLAPRVVAQSNLVAIVVESAVGLSGAVDQLHVVPPPLSLDPVRLQMLWHRRTANDPAQRWLRARIARLLGADAAPEGRPD